MTWTGDPVSIYDMILAIKAISTNRFSVNELIDTLSTRGYYVEPGTSMVIKKPIDYIQIQENSPTIEEMLQLIKEVGC